MNNSADLSEAAQLWRVGRAGEARRRLLDLTSKPEENFEICSLLAQIDLEEQQGQAAQHWARAALKLERSGAAAWYTLARAQRELGNLTAAVASYQRALAIEPGNSVIWTSLGTALYYSGRRDQAIDSYRRALALDPGNAGARASLDQLTQPPAGGMIRLGQIREEAQRLHRAGQLAEALDLHREALRIAPHLAGIWFSAGLLADEMGEQWTSLPFFEEAARLDPNLFPAIEAARRICVAVGLREKALRYAERAYALKPSDDIRIAQALTLSAIQPSLEAMFESRRAFDAGLDAAIDAALEARDISAAHGMGAFFLAYHGEVDKDLQAKAARLLAGATPGISMTAPHCSSLERRQVRIRVGFISRFLFSHSIGATTRGLVAELSRDRFEVFVLRITPSKVDAVTVFICRAAEHTIVLDADFRIAREQIAALELDVLFYQDIGMEPTSYLLAFSRLAPVQCVSFGHPNTTGIPTMDYFISNDLFEPPDAAQHYTEKLFLLHDLPTLAYYYRPEIPPAPADRAEFGLHEKDHVYCCPQALMKVHPEFDAVLGAILRRDPEGIIVLVGGGYVEYTDQVRERLARTVGDVIGRILFLDAMPYPRYLQLLVSADVCLDTLHFNGMNSSLEAFAASTPIVTLPGRLQRGRHTQAMYRKMGILECIAKDAKDYVDIAVRLGTDREYAASIRNRIRALSGVLYEDRRVVAEFERFFVQAVREAIPGFSEP
jgi:predicted O-linked N-acetylglucosamine transferase (SPINDLY family)